MAPSEVLSVLRTHFWLVLITLAIGIVCAVVALRLAVPAYSATSSVMIVSPANGRDPSATAIDMPSLLTSDTVLSRTRTRMNDDESLADLRKRISAEIDQQSTIMPISFVDESPDLAIRGANVLAEELRTRYREISASRYDDLATYLSAALNREQSRMTDLDRNIAVLTRRDPYLAQKNASDAISAEIVGLDQQRSAIQGSLESHSLAQTLAHDRVSSIDPLATNEILSADARYAALSQRFAHDSAEASIARAQFTPAYPGLTGLADQLGRTHAVLEKERVRALGISKGASPSYAAAARDLDNARVAMSADKAALAQLDASMTRAESHLAAAPTLGVRLSALQRDRDAAGTAYAILSEQRTITLAQQAEAAALSSVTIVDSATAAQRARGRGAVLLPIATVLAFTVVAFGLPFALEILDPRLRSRETIEALYRKPLIARVPS